MSELVTRRTWIERGIWLASGSGAAWAFTAWVGLRPRPALLAALLVAAAAVLWVFTDLASQVTRVEFAAPRRRIAARHGLDPRFLRTARLLRDEDREQVIQRVHQDLVRVVDDRLLTHHGIDRDTDPDAALRVVGPELAAFVGGTPHPRQLHPRQLDALLTRIEAL